MNCRWKLLEIEIELCKCELKLIWINYLWCENVNWNWFGWKTQKQGCKYNWIGFRLKLNNCVEFVWFYQEFQFWHQCEFHNEIDQILTQNHMNFMMVKTSWCQNVNTDFGTYVNFIMKLTKFWLKTIWISWW